MANLALSEDIEIYYARIPPQSPRRKYIEVNTITYNQKSGQKILHLAKLRLLAGTLNQILNLDEMVCQPKFFSKLFLLIRCQNTVRENFRILCCYLTKILILFEK